MIPGRSYISGSFVLKREYALNIHVSGACYKITEIGVFACELITNQVTAIEQILTINKVILVEMPAG